MLLEQAHIKNAGSEAALNGVRTGGGKYTEYQGGFRESYSLATDPYELENAYAAGAPPSDLATRLQAFKDCAGVTCWAAEDGS